MLATNSPIYLFVSSQVREFREKRAITQSAQKQPISNRQHTDYSCCVPCPFLWVTPNVPILNRCCNHMNIICLLPSNTAQFCSTQKRRTYFLNDHTQSHSHTVTQITSTMIKMVVVCEFQRFELTNDTKFTFIAEFVIKTLDLVHFRYDLRLKNIRISRWTNPIISHNMNWSVAYRLLIIDKDNHRMTNSCIWAIVCDVLCGFCLIQDLSTDLNWILKKKPCFNFIAFSYSWR